MLQPKLQEWAAANSDYDPSYKSNKNEFESSGLVLS